jgi:hypothetical protein
MSVRMTDFRPGILRLLVIGVLAAAMTWPAAAAAQTPAPRAPRRDPDRTLDVSQTDFTVVTLPTTLRLPRGKGAFRVTHRFLRPLGQGSFGDLSSDLFGLDSGAQIGLEYRYGVWSGLQAGFHRTSDRTIELFSEYNVLQQGPRGPLGLSIIGSVEGTNNFRDRYTPSLGVAVSRELGKHGAIYAEPIWVNRSNIAIPAGAVAPTVDRNTFMVGLGARIRVRPTVYIVGEVMPRVAGYRPDSNQGSFAIEKRVGGHSFQLNFSDNFGTTMGQIARGGASHSDWYMGFNISRKFF